MITIVVGGFYGDEGKGKVVGCLAVHDKPQLADLRESGAIEQGADVVMFLYTKDEEFSSQRVVSINISKHRNGAVGEKIYFSEGIESGSIVLKLKRGNSSTPELISVLS